jgi:metal-sulfur cluster biosynthetic enzyme
MPTKKTSHKLEAVMMDKLQLVLDPELGVSIVDLGLVYNVTVSAGKAKVLMTLTTIGCPLFGTIEKDIEDRILEIPEVDDVVVELTFDPPWSPAKMTAETRIRLGLD